MAVSTNLGLYLPTREDYISVKRDLSDNYEVIDEHAGMMENGSAIVINGDTAPKAITSGQYLLIKNHSTLASGSYHATTNIANGATIDNSNVAIDTNGLSNALKGEINTLNSNLSSRPTHIAFGTTSKTLYQNLVNSWTTDVPNDGMVHNASIQAQYGAGYGWIVRYSNNYGVACLARYNGDALFYFLSNGTVTEKRVASQS